MLNTLAMFNVEVAALILVGVLVIFGGKKIPELMRGIGQGVGELKKGMEDGQRQIMHAAHHDPDPKPAEEPKATQVEAPVATVTPQ
jgi:sec-independent protein translocase protein TatA